MKDVFEHAYQGTLNLFSEAVEVVVACGKFIGVCMVYLTIPIWLLPYALFLRKGERKLKDNMSQQDYEIQQLLDGKSRMEVDEILGGMENGKL